MVNRIIELKSLYKVGVNRKLFELLILHCTDGVTANRFGQAYANIMSIEEWVNHYSRTANANKEQLEYFFKYLKSYSEYFDTARGSKNELLYFVHKNIKKDSFYTEDLVLLAFELFEKED